MAKKRRSSYRNSKASGPANRNADGSDFILSPQIEKDIANFNWSYPIGLDYPFSPFGNGQDSEPVLMTFYVQPTIGMSKSPQSAANLMAKKLYNYVVRINARRVNYEPVDLEIMIMAMSSLHSYIEFMKRLYRFGNTYSNMNRSIPDALFDACGVDGYDIRNHMDDFRAWINLFMQKASMLTAPKGIKLFDRANLLYGNVFLDEPSEKAQMYMFVPDVFYRYVETEGPGYLEPVPLFYDTNGIVPSYTKQDCGGNDGRDPVQWTRRQIKHTFDSLTKLGDKLLDSLLDSEDISLMSADIYKAYGTSGLVSFYTLSESEMIQPRYDEGMLMQIENMIMLQRGRYYNLPMDFDSVYIYFPVITQSTSPDYNGYLTMEYSAFLPDVSNSASDRDVWDKIVSYDGIAGIINLQKYGKLLNYHGSEPSTRDVMVMTRLIPCLTLFDTVIRDGDSKPQYIMERVDYCGTEIVVDTKITSMIHGQPLRLRDSANWIEFSTPISRKGKFDFKYSAAMAMNYFNRHPEVLIMADDWTELNSNHIAAQLIDLDKWTTINYVSMRRLHEAALLAQFDVPGYGNNLNG